MVNRDEETIIAQTTPSGRGAIALIRLSGADAFKITDAIAQLPHDKKISSVATHTIHFGFVVDNGKNIDHVLFFVMHAPKTFTGQNTVEISCHNNPFIIQAIIAQALRHGARIAQPGEFTKRAYLNKKIDLIQAEAINELICAHTQQALQKSLAQLQGSFSHWLADIEQQLIHALALTQASFEFIEEENITFDQQIQAIIAAVLNNIAIIEQSYSHQQHIKDGIRIALLGAVNAGKSSLFNTLIKHDRAIVTDIAGTTRDVIEAGVYRDSFYATYIDTAGLRQTADIIEQEGIKRSWQQAQKADIIILVIDGARSLTEQERTIYHDLLNQYKQKIILVATKSDIAQPQRTFDDTPVLAISTVTQEHIPTLEQAIALKAQQLLESGDAPFLVNQRQFSLLLQLKNDLEQILKLTTDTIDYEIVAVHLKDALERLTELTGKTITERSVDTIFQEFCVGK